ncbi:DNA cytosine methyltransferase [Pelosinus sp. sgz500959]|uniref:DNA cytosine methyltransferase n=1 Tax=Pelosinus sp. sgz500959 TaxID=3242472 RepID=UPI00367104BA
MRYNAIDLFAGCGGVSEGLHQAGFNVIAAIELNRNASRAYSANHKECKMFNEDIRKLDAEKIRKVLKEQPLHLLSGCPPCQGFSSMRRLNRKQEVNDGRNDLVLEYLRFVRELKPLTIMMENVPALGEYSLFKEVLSELDKMGYNPKCHIVNVANYGVAQRRKRFIMVGSLIGNLDIAKGNDHMVTVRDVIFGLENVNITTDVIHKVYPKHIPRIQKMISLIPKNGGSRKSLPPEYLLECHKKQGVGFNDVYGRLRWDNVSSTITGGCLNPSKGRFLHPEENRCITAREAALLQSFPRNYIFPIDIPKTELALLIGNALPPEFSRIQGTNIYKHLEKYCK